MRRLLDWWTDLTSVLTDPEVLMGLTIVGGVLAIAALAAYSIWRWRVEKAFVGLEIRDVLARLDHYATAIPDHDSSAPRNRRRDYLQEAIDRWLRLQYELWTDFQVYLALRITRSIQPATSQSAAALAAGFGQLLTGLWGNPDKTLFSAVVNNALATAFGMRPTPPRRQILPETGATRMSPEDDAHVDALLRLFDPYAMEDGVISELQTRGPVWLHSVLRTLEWHNAHSPLAVRVDGLSPLVLEMVFWIVHEEQIGPVPLSRDLLDIYEVGPQLLPHLPEFMRDSSIQSVQRLGTKQLAVTLANVIVPKGSRFEGSIGLPAPLRADGELWKSSRIEFDVTTGTGAVLFENR